MKRFTNNIFILLSSAMLLLFGCTGEDSRQMHEALMQAKAQNENFEPFTTDSTMLRVVDYYDSHGTANEQMLAHYLLGCVYRDLGDAPRALECYYDAVSKSDTTEADCDFNILRGVYGQMSRIFHKQNLPNDEIWALNHYIEYTKRTADEKDYIIAKGQLIRPYYLLGDTNKVLKIINERYQKLIYLGDEKTAAASISTAIHIHITRSNLSAAKELMTFFEKESGLFDNNGNITKGREAYYYTKGFYELGINNLEMAENYFRKAINHGFLSEGYRGLLNVYRKKNMIDSVLHYSELYESAQDSLHNKMRTESIRQIAALYNYNKSQKEAEKEKEKVAKTQKLTISIALIAITIIIYLSWLYQKNTRKKKQKIHELQLKLNNAENTRCEVLNELNHLKAKDYESIISAKEYKLIELTETIEQLQTENDAYKVEIKRKNTDSLEQFLSSDIANFFIKKSIDKSEKVIPTETDWKTLVSQFGKNCPSTYKTFGSGKPLSKLELRICILLVLDIPEYIIAIMTETTASTISNLKARANEKLYNKKEAHPLKTNLIHTLKAY